MERNNVLNEIKHRAIEMALLLRDINDFVAQLSEEDQQQLKTVLRLTDDGVRGINNTAALMKK